MNTGTQSFVKDAPANLVYVADYSKTELASEDDKNLYSGADCGFTRRMSISTVLQKGLLALSVVLLTDLGES